MSEGGDIDQDVLAERWNGDAIAPEDGGEACSGSNRRRRRNLGSTGGVARCAASRDAQGRSQQRGDGEWERTVH